MKNVTTQVLKLSWGQPQNKSFRHEGLYKTKLYKTKSVYKITSRKNLIRVLFQTK